MRRPSYILLICILIIESNVPYAYSEVIKKDSQLMSTEEDTNSICIKKDEFNEIIGQLQGMRDLLEEMKQDYDSRLKEMQEKIATLEKEKTEPEKEKIPWEENTSIPPETDSKLLETSVISEEEASMLSRTDTITNTPPPSQTVSPSPESETTESAMPLMNTTTPDQSAGAGTGHWSPAQPITLWSSGQSYMNISFNGLFAAAGSTAKDLEKIETGAHDPVQRGFTVQNLETTFEGAIDPYFKGQANIIFQIDKDGESSLEVEEAYLTSLSLPLNLQVKAGTFFTEFGRQNQLHPHAWNFADQPLVNGRFLGPDGMRNPGARLSWLAPTNNYTELFFTVQNSQGETVHSFRFEEDGTGLFGREAVETRVHSMEDLLYVPRIATSFDITDEQTVLLGASAAFGPNSTGRDKNTLIYGIDMFWKWKSKYAAGGFPFVSWQTEVMGRRFEAGEDVNSNLPDEVMNNWGAYSQIMWGFKKRWIAGLRGDYVDGEKEATDPLGFERWRLSPNITFYPSEFSKIRLQYNYDTILGNDSTEHSVFLQFEFLLGSHGAHKF
ncbi:MAG: hypothetical protein DWB56_04375 [Candidatus Jettenia sp.]|nr:hypothetical protein [Candidatus Jettenia sp. AMX1]MBC6928193.1 hypothetical protein [Candidatus Jettenia sp.]GIL19384.1 MAG: hypothetical protein BroJett041_04980 [Candidatus Jettenia caeni]MCE7879582.1 hypothetical protein [Candidatus Jettenia sp. AMX1]MCQ3926941.1 hypothetical protein [Candidatus Jettenia sp.]MDL1939183.1 hypothetical protein [Candidatus Jettenia sp. AMX1]